MSKKRGDFARIEDSMIRKLDSKLGFNKKQKVKSQKLKYSCRIGDAVVRYKRVEKYVERILKENKK